MIQTLTSTTAVTAGTITWPYHLGVVAGITRANWEAAEAAMRSAVLVWAAAKGVTSLTQISARRPAFIDLRGDPAGPGPPLRFASAHDGA